MRRILVAGAALALMGAVAHADDQDKRTFGAAAGGTTGAVAGAAVGGPVGAVVGGVAGATIGAATAVPKEVQTYVVENPAEPVVIEGEISTGATLPPDVDLVTIPDSPEYAYVYVDDGPVVVERETRRVVWVR